MRVTFQLRHSDQASTFNTDRRDDTLIGETIVAYDGLVVVRVPGWRWAHTVKRECVAPEGRETRWGAGRLADGSWLVRSPRQPDGKHLLYPYQTGVEVLAAFAGGESGV